LNSWLKTEGGGSRSVACDEGGILLPEDMRIGDYEVLGELGRGGAGVVHRARGPDGRVVAIKTLLESSPSAVERFGREIQMLKGLGLDEGFVPLLDVGRCESGPFLVMPFLRGGTLAETLKRGPLELVDLLVIAGALSRAVGRAHEKGIVHRDLKPENILFDETGRPYIADLGLAKFAAGEGSSIEERVSLSKTGEMRGTFGYMAPEQLEDAKNIGPAADVFSLGALIYECASGREPFLAGSAMQRVSLVLAGDYPPLPSLVSGLPIWLARLIDDCLSVDPGRRPGDGTELAERLELGPLGLPGESRSGVFVVGVGLLILGLVLAFGMALGVRALRPSERARGPRDGVAKKPNKRERPDIRERPLDSGGAARSAVLKNTIVAAPDSSLPLFTRSFRRSKRLRLERVLGSPAGRHRGPVMGLAMSKDGRRLATRARNGQVILWNPKTGIRLRTIPGAEQNFALSPEGALLATVDAAGAIRIQSLKGNRPSRQLGKAASGLRSLAFDPSSRWLAVLRGIRLFIYGVGGGSETIDYGEVDAERMIWNEAGLFLISGGVLLLPKPTEAQESTLLEFSSGRFACQPAGLAILRGPELSMKRLTGKRLWHRRVWSSTCSLALSRTGAQIAVGNKSGKIAVYRLDGKARRRSFEAHSGAISTLRFSEDGSRLLSGGEDGMLRCWELGRREIKSAWEPVGEGHRRPVFAIAALRSGHFLSADGSGRVSEWEPDSGKESRPFEPGKGTINELAVSPDGRLILSAEYRRTARLIRVQGWRLRNRWTKLDFNVLTAAFSPLGGLAATGSDGRGLRFYDTEKAREFGGIRLKSGRKEAFLSFLRFSSDGRRILAGLMSGEIQVLSVPDGKLLGELVLRQRTKRRGFAASADHRFVAMAPINGPIVAWDLSEPRSPRRLSGGLGSGSIIYLARDERSLFTVQPGPTLSIFDPGGGRLDCLDLRASGESLMCLETSLDGRRLYIGTGSGTIYVFAIKS